MEVSKDLLLELSQNKLFMYIVHKAVEDHLVEWRDAMMGSIRRNGLVIYSRDGEPSSVIRFSTDEGMRLGLIGVAETMEKWAIVDFTTLSESTQRVIADWVAKHDFATGKDEGSDDT